MLETVCNQEGANGNDLFAKLDDLAARGRIPDMLAEVAHELRQLGNLGAHDEEVSVAPDDVPVIRRPTSSDPGNSSDFGQGR